MPNDYNQYQPYTGFFTRDPNTGNSQDLGQRYVTKSYLLDVYPNIASQLGNRTSPGLFAWGFNNQGRLGLGDTTSRSSPVQVGTLTDWKQLAAGGGSVLCVKTDGTLWAWGDNTDGVLGLSDRTARSSPVQVGILTNWKQIAKSNSTITACIKTDGTLWTWGPNGDALAKVGALGQGLGQFGRVSSPVQVGSLTNWKQVGCGGFHTACVKTDGTLWTWGDASTGQLGLGDGFTDMSSPVQVGTLTNWKQVAGGESHTACIKTDGTLWTWGENSSGQLGLLDRTARSSPVQVGVLTNWKQVVCGTFHTACIKTDGTLWTWGENSSGQLGLQDIANRSSPVQVGSLTNWKQVSSLGNYTACIKTDGTLWMFGYNGVGNQGLGDAIARSSPVQVGSLTNWKQVSISGTVTSCILDATF